MLPFLYILTYIPPLYNMGLNTGIVSDLCEFELDDFDGVLQFPNTEAKVVVSLGYKETGLTKIGTYFVREISIDGARHVVRIQCNAASKAMRSQKTKTNEGTIEDKISSNLPFCQKSRK